MFEQIINNPLKIIGLIIVGLCICYIAVRAMAYGAVRSYFQARRDYYKKLKGELLCHNEDQEKK